MTDRTVPTVEKRDQEGPVLLVGWKRIAAACGMSVGWTKKLARKYRMPYILLFGHVAIARVVLVDWVRGLCALVAEGEERGPEGGAGKLEHFRGRNLLRGEREREVVRDVGGKRGRRKGGG